MNELASIEAALRKHLTRLEAKSERTPEDAMHISLIDYVLGIQEVGVRFAKCREALRRIEGGQVAEVRKT